MGTSPSILLPIFAIAGLSWFLVKRFNLSPYVAPLCSIGSIVSGLYLSDFLSLMKITAIFFLIAGNFLFGYCILCICKSGQGIGKRRALLLTLLIGGLAILYILNRDAAYINWDEFSHWGTIVKLVESEDTFHLKQRLIRYYFEDYPPGTALLSYFFLQATGYSEPVVHFSYSIILIAGCLPTIGLAFSASYARGFLSIVACYLLVVFLGQSWSSVLIDQVVGILFGGVICAYWLQRDAPSNRILLLAPILCFLVLSKQSGASFSLLATMLIFVDRLWAIRFETTLANKALSALPIAGLWLAPKLILASWTWHVDNDELTKTFSATNLGEAFSKLAQCCHTDHELATTANFFNAMTGAQPHRSTPGSFLHVLADQVLSAEVVQSLWNAVGHVHGRILIFFCIVLCISLFLSKKSLRGRLALFSGAIIGAGLVYALTLLVYYLYVFSPYEGRMITSHVRFLNTYHIALGLFATGALLSTPPVTFRGNRFAALLTHTLPTGIASFLIGVLLLHTLVVNIPATKNYFKQAREVRAPIRKFLEPVLSATPKHSNVYALWESSGFHENGFQFWIMHYELRPRNTNLFCFSLGPPQYKGDIWSCDKNEEQVRKEFSGYQYVAVGSGVQTLRRLYPQVFALASAEENSGIFEVIKDASNQIALRPFRPGSATQSNR